MTAPLNSCSLGSARWMWESGSRAGHTPSQGNHSKANCHFHSWVDVSKSFNLSPGLLSWWPLLPTTAPSKTVYRWKDVATAHMTLQTSQFDERGISKPSSWRSPHAHGCYHRSQAFYGYGGRLFVWMSSAAILPQFIFVSLTRKMVPLKFFINRIYFQTPRSARKTES